MEMEGLSEEVRVRFLQLRKAFIQQLPSRWDEIHQCRNQAQSLSDALHKLCGVAGGFGLSHLAALAKRAEQEVLEGQLVDVEQTLELLSEEIRHQVQLGAS